MNDEVGMGVAPWRSRLAGALHRNRSLPYARYVQLATVRADGRPANRTVVFRGFLENTNQLQFITDTRSEKIDQIRYQPWSEVCWYFPNTREQFRLGGVLTLVQEAHPEPTLNTARHLLWNNLSDAARIQFAWANPGKPRLDDDPFTPSQPDPTVPLPNFCLLLLNPTEVDHLELRGNPQNRCHYLQDKNQVWSVESVNP